MHEQEKGTDQAGQNAEKALLNDGDKPAKAAKTAKVDDGLTAVSKDGVTLRVHKDAVAEHKRLGWKAD